MLAGLRSRDRAALGEIVEAHHGFLVRMVTPLVSREFAEDVVQEAWIKAFAAAGRFEGRAALRTWLGQIALNTARSWRRTRRREAGPGGMGYGYRLPGSRSVRCGWQLGAPA